MATANFAVAYGGNMRIRELLADVAKILESDDLAQAIQDSTEGQSYEFSVKTDRLLYAYNLVLSDVSLNYVAPTFSEKVAGKIFNTDNLSYACKKIVSILDANGNQVKFKTNCNQISTGKSGVVVTYEYIPKNQKIDEEFEYENKLISSRAFCYGICAEYCLFSSRFEEAENWESKFRQAVDVRIDFKPRRLKAGARWGL